MCKACNSGGKPIGAIWWRVSTGDQLEASPDIQIAGALELANQDGCQIPQENILGTDWHSLSVWESPPMERLKEKVRNESIHGVFMYDADRGPDKPVHRLLFRALCKENGVPIRCVHGQVPDGEMGEVMEFMSAWAKEKQVLRAQQGARDGLRARATLKGLPVNGNPPYGFRFRKEGGIPVALEPDPDTYPVACLIWRMALAGFSTRAIQRALSDVPTPRGGKQWSPRTITGILHNPAYGGRYYALRQAVKEPERRRKASYGKSSTKRLNLDEAHYLPDFQIIDQVVTWEEFQQVQEQLTRNKENSTRNAKRFYMLRGMLFCGADGRRLSGHALRQRYVYECPRRRGRDPGETCSCPRLPGTKLEDRIWDKVSAFLRDPQLFAAEMERRKSGGGDEDSNIHETLDDLARKLRDVDRRETELVNLKLRGQVSEVPFEWSGALLRADRSYLLDEIQRQKAVLATRKRQEDAADTLTSLRGALVQRLETATPEGRRWVLEQLDTRITVPTTGDLEISVGVPDPEWDCVNYTQGQ